jgi:hypothetical protein
VLGNVLPVRDRACGLIGLTRWDRLSQGPVVSVGVTTLSGLNLLFAADRVRLTLSASGSGK